VPPPATRSRRPSANPTGTSFSPASWEQLPSGASPHSASPQTGAPRRSPPPSGAAPGGRASRPYRPAPRTDSPRRQVRTVGVPASHRSGPRSPLPGHAGNVTLRSTGESLPWPTQVVYARRSIFPSARFACCRTHESECWRKDSIRERAPRTRRCPRAIIAAVARSSSSREAIRASTADHDAPSCERGRRRSRIASNHVADR